MEERRSIGESTIRYEACIAKRKREIQKAIDLLGWIGVGDRIKSPEDRAIFAELGKENLDKQRTREDERLKKHHIKF